MLAQKILTLTVKKYFLKSCHFTQILTNCHDIMSEIEKYFVADLYLLQVSVMICILIQRVEFYQDTVLQRQHHVHP